MILPFFSVKIMAQPNNQQVHQQNQERVSSAVFSAPKVGTMFQILNLGKDAVEEYDQLLKKLDSFDLEGTDSTKATISNLEALQDQCVYPNAAEKSSDLMAFISEDSAQRESSEESLKSFCSGFYDYAVKYGLNKEQSENQTEALKEKALAQCEKNLESKRADYSQAGYALIMNHGCQLNVDEDGNYSADSSFKIIAKAQGSADSFGCDAEFNDTFTEVTFPSLNKSYRIDRAIADLSRNAAPSQLGETSSISEQPSNPSSSTGQASGSSSTSR